MSSTRPTGWWYGLSRSHSVLTTRCRASSRARDGAPDAPRLVGVLAHEVRVVDVAEGGHRVRVLHALRLAGVVDRPDLLHQVGQAPRRAAAAAQLRRGAPRVGEMRHHVSLAL